MLSRSLLSRKAVSVAQILTRRSIVTRAGAWSPSASLLEQQQWPFNHWKHSRVGARHSSTAMALTILTPPAVFVGLVLTLWTWKCIMMVLFQDKIIYMPSVPPFSRQESVKDYAAACRPVAWREEYVRASDGTRLCLCIGRSEARHAAGPANSSRLILLYFQGNASSTPPRLPMLSSILRGLDTSPEAPHCSIVTISYRGFWKSSGRASQAGIEKDAMAALDRVFDLARESDAKIMLWGQSIGASVAIDVLMRHRQRNAIHTPEIVGILLETPFTSIRNMLAALYPQDWLPYKYLWPFLWNKWDNQAAIKRLAGLPEVPPFRIIAAEKDEVVPSIHSSQLADECTALGINCGKVVVADALHHETTTKSVGRQAIMSFIVECCKPTKTL